MAKLLVILLAVVTCWRAAGTYVNPLFTGNTPDPWVIYTNGNYYHTRTTGGNIRVYRSSTLQGLASATVATVFTPNAEILSDIWAPELHDLGGKWYIYSTGNVASSGAKQMRMFVLEANTQTPQGAYTYKGMLDPDLPGIDATVLTRDFDGARFLVWSQFDDAGQSLYLGPLLNPWTLGTPRVRISTPTYSWERHGNVNEGPEILKRNGKTFIIYSGSGTWTVYYCLGLLQNTDGNYTNAASWTKFSNPVFQQSTNNGTYCVGHCSFTKSPSGLEDWLVYHGSSDPSGDQMSKRYTRIQRFWWNSDGTPNFDVPTAANVPLLAPDEAPGKPAQGLRGEFFPNTTLSGAPVLSTNYTMEFDWGSGAPLPSLGANSFSARWTGKLLAPTSGVYTFQVVNDDGARLWVNGTSVINDWTLHSARTNSGAIQLRAGVLYDFRLEYYESTGDAELRAWWIPPGGTVETIPGANLFPHTNGLAAEYFVGTNLSSLALARLDPQVDFTWSTGIPGLGVPSDRFSARWTGQVIPRYSETYSFYVNSDNGRRLWVDNQLIIDKWLNDWGTEYSGTITLVAGKRYNLRLEYFEDIGGALCQLSWSSASQTREIVPPSQLVPPYNLSPTLNPVADQRIPAGRTLLISNVATDPDIPKQSLTFSLLSAPAGATINATNGVFTWRPAIAQSPSTNQIVISVNDNGLPDLWATQSFLAAVEQPLTPSISWTPNATSLVFRITGSPGPDYLVESCTNVANPEWTALWWTNSPPIPFIGPTIDPASSTQSFFRVRLLP